VHSENRTYGQVREIPSNVEETRTITFIASTPARDRHRSVLNQKNWKLDNFSNNPVIGYQHNVYGDPCKEDDPDNVIGSGRAYVDGDMLLVDVTFESKEVNPKAEKIFRKILAGTLRAVSVGFLPIGNGGYGEGNEAYGAENETYYFEGQELIELSVVNIPSNPEAIKKQLRSNTAAAMVFIKGHMPGHSFADIEKMSIGEVLKSLEGKANPTPVNKPDPIIMKQNKKGGNSIIAGIRGLLDKLDGKSRMTVTAEDGTVIEVDREEGDPEVGDSATVGGEPANGEFVLPDGSTIVCVDGIITEIKPASEEEAETSSEEEARLFSENTRLLKENGELRSENEELKKALQEFEGRLRKLSSTKEPKQRQQTFGRGDEADPENRFQAARERRQKQNSK
jgi:hypothetical protein